MRLRLQGQEVRHWLHCFFSSFVIKAENLHFLFCLLICHLSSVLYYYNTNNACICSVYVHACGCACVLGGGGVWKCRFCIHVFVMNSHISRP